MTTWHQIVSRTMAWAERAACVGLDPEIFYSKSKGYHYRRARAICRTCPVTRECLEYAMEIEDPTGPNAVNGYYRYGMWGGKTPHERRMLAKARRITP